MDTEEWLGGVKLHNESAVHACFWDMLHWSPQSPQPSSTQVPVGCCKLGRDVVSLKLFWPLLVMALATALCLVLLGMVNANSLLPSHPNLYWWHYQVQPMAWVLSCVSAFLFLITLSPNTHAAISSNRERSFPQLEAHWLFCKTCSQRHSLIKIVPKELWFEPCITAWCCFLCHFSRLLGM